MSGHRRIISPLRPGTSVRSISAFDNHHQQHPEEDEDDDEGAAIPDIPTRKSSRAQNIVDFITSPRRSRTSARPNSRRT
ncbi:hypothetical protein PG994_008817 [Apiospora phragmitis]|uniref:Uncharacterized protein n=1 Tax=Apiospora phragmitis TaxID=2905665 RepID=A0ABR1UKJ5_9PEZI